MKEGRYFILNTKSKRNCPLVIMTSTTHAVPIFLFIIWLGTPAGKMKLSCLVGTTRRVPQEKFTRKPYNKSFIEHLFPVKMAGYCHRSFLFIYLFFRVYGPRLRLGL